MIYRLLSLIQNAQEAFYNKDYEKTHKLIEESLMIRETAEAYAMLGSLGYMQNQTNQALEYWQRSLELKPNQPKIVKAIEKMTGGK